MNDGQGMLEDLGSIFAGIFWPSWSIALKYDYFKN